MSDQKRINIARDARREFDNGMKCELWGHPAKDMTHDELIVFVGYLNEVVTHELYKYKNGACSAPTMGAPSSAALM